MIQALLIALWAGICSVDDVGPQMIRRPLLTGFVTGIIMGDIQQGLIIGATLELMWMGIGNVGAYSAPDVVCGAIIGTALGITSGGGVATGVALAVPCALLAQQLLVLCRTVNCALVPVVERIAETGDFDKMRLIFVPSGIMYFLVRAVPCFLAVYFGSDMVTSIVEMLPAKIMSGLSSASSVVPAIGIALLLLMMVKNGASWVFLLLGFTLSTYLGLGTLPIAFIALAFALLYDLATSKKNAPAQVVTTENEEEFDL